MIFNHLLISNFSKLSFVIVNWPLIWDTSCWTYNLFSYHDGYFAWTIWTSLAYYLPTSLHKIEKRRDALAKIIWIGFKSSQYFIQSLFFPSLPQLYRKIKQNEMDLEKLQVVPCKKRVSQISHNIELELYLKPELI